MSESKTEFVYHALAQDVVMGNQKTPVMFHVHIVRQQRIDNVRVQILPVKARIHLLF